MLELGDKAEQYHWELGAYAAKKADRVLCVGTLAQHIYTGAKEAGAEAFCFGTQDELLAKIWELVRKDDAVLVKASRGMQLEKTVEFLLK